MYGIPNMKLEKSIVERRVKLMEKEGVVFRTGCEVGTDISAKWISDELDAVVLACGTALCRDIKVPGREAKGIHFAVDYLSAATKGLLNNKRPAEEFYAEGKDVLIIGGGDTGNDCVGTAIRQGARSVTQLEMMPKQPGAGCFSQWSICPGFIRLTTVRKKRQLSSAPTPEFSDYGHKVLTDGEGRVNGAELYHWRLRQTPKQGARTWFP